MSNGIVRKLPGELINQEIAASPSVLGATSSLTIQRVSSHLVVIQRVPSTIQWDLSRRTIQPTRTGWTFQKVIATLYKFGITLSIGNGVL
jgi:hypothetical protein